MSVIKLKWEIINCSKFDSLKKLVDTKISTARRNWSTKVLENVNCSTQFIVYKMVYMYGS